MSVRLSNGEVLEGIPTKELTKCALCKQGLMHDNAITFTRVTLDRCVFNPRAIRQRHGLEQFFGGGQGGAALAEVMGAGEDLAAVVGQDKRLVCDTCLCTPGALVRLTELEKPEQTEGVPA